MVHECERLGIPAGQFAKRQTCYIVMLLACWSTSDC